jgi:hypothetical protein
MADVRATRISVHRVAAADQLCKAGRGARSRAVDFHPSPLAAEGPGERGN